MSYELCSHCRQPLVNTRDGVRLSKLKTQIYDIVKRSGDTGVSTADIAATVYGRGVKSELIAMHVHQINDLLAHASTRIKGVRAGRYSRYIMVQEK